MSVSGFQASGKINDGTAGAFVALAGLMTISLPSREAGTFDATELDQADPDEQTLPTGTIKNGPVQCELFYTKDNYLRINGLVGVRGKTLSLTTPDDQTSGTPTKLMGNFPGFVSKIDAVKYEKGTPVSIPFEYTVQSKPTFS